MCARFSLSKADQEIAKTYEVKVIDPFAPSYNTAPGMNSAIITADQPQGIQQYHFGLVPHWAKDVKIGYKMFNAKAETITELPSFKPLMNKGKRCLVLVDGFYEWKTEAGQKQPYRFELTDRDVFAFAGLYSHWHNPQDQQWYRSFSIITTTPNQTVGELHNRMPVILSPEEEKLWLAQDVPAKELLPLLDTYPDEEMKKFRVSKDVNKAVNNYADLILPQNSK
ncbi:SOS response-associated peptidase [Mucilaginibacter robiniae]|uniref:Abasic site processing protein n=1 Tax=Mucilaginibacter robiniae TaxID=2728022 RepID=A0A7L5DWQ4_9SPHI|nr:SOS response-associated peptidase [Mucilaginibacter robiniae]QJD95181.1 SOS response-associated peptidase [Mucilaginibacter robiniae]